MPMPTLMLTSPRGMSRIPLVGCQDAESWVQFSNPGNVSNEVTGADVAENVTASGEEAIVGVEDSMEGAKGCTSVDDPDRGCATMSTEDDGTAVV